MGLSDKKIFRIIRNKYFLTVISLIVWLVFFDKNDVFTQFELIEKCRKLEADKNYYLSEIASNKAGLLDLRTNKRSLEKFAREKYLMKKDNEDVFVIVAK
jgi:cell division protein FtsB